MKKGWEYKKLGLLATYINGFAFTPNDWESEGKPIIRIQNLTDNSTHCNRCKRTDIPEKYNVVKGDVLISWSATLGVFEWDREDSWLNQHIFKVVFDKIEINKQFFKYIVESSLEEMAKHTNGATMKHIRKGDFDNILVPVPPLSEQHSIVDYLDSAFAKIDAMKANAEKALNEAKALFQASLKEMLEPKEGWEEKKLEDITEVKDGTHDSPKYVTEGIPFVTQKNITIKGFDLLNTKKITLEDHKKFYTRSNVEFGDIIIAMIGANRGMSCIVDTREIFSIKNVGLIKKNDNINMRYLLFYLHSPSANTYILDNSNGGAQEFIGLKGLRTFPIPYPPLSEQQSIVTTLDSLKSKVDRLQANYEKISQECDALKQAILRQVFE